MRSAIRAEVASIEPMDEIERAHVEDALAWIDSGSDLCRIQKPAIPPKHLEIGAPVGMPLMLTCSETVGLTAGHMDVSLWYVIAANRQGALRFDTDEFNAVQWFHLSEVPLSRSDPHLGRFLRKLSDRRR